MTFLVLRNEEYMILKWFAEFEQAAGVPGLDLPGLDVAAVARAYGVPAREVSSPEELVEALREGDRRGGRPAPGRRCRSPSACGWTDAGRSEDWRAPAL